MTVQMLRENHPAAGSTVTLFFAGWGMDERPFAELADFAVWSNPTASAEDSAPSPTLLLVTDHGRTPDEDVAVIRRVLGEAWEGADTAAETTLHVVGWSFGVRAAADWLLSVHDDALLSELLRARPFLNFRASFVAGTMRPVDRAYGIPPAVAALTQRTLSDESIRMFRARMVGDDATSPFLARAPERSVESLARELAYFRALSEDTTPQAAGQVLARAFPTLSVTAHVPEKDLIVPPAAQVRFWEAFGEVLGNRFTLRRHPDAPHGDFALLSDILRGAA